jgi:hypothetical protein|tara:strand:+ start:6635 stop:6862 length:228 start_codon:yes stop_codon:yes gene_type:complete
MAQYWYKKDKRVKRISDQDEHKDVVQQIKDLKAKGYVRVSDRRNPEGSIVEKPLLKIKNKLKTKFKKKPKKKDKK